MYCDNLVTNHQLNYIERYTVVYMLFCIHVSSEPYVSWARCSCHLYSRDMSDSILSGSHSQRRVSHKPEAISENTAAKIQGTDGHFNFLSLIQ